MILFDPAAKRIVLDSVAVTASELWSRWVDWAVLSDNAKYLPAFRQAGGDDLGGGLSIPPYMFLLNGWRVRPLEANQTVIITGNLFVDGGGVPVVSTLGNFNVSVQYTVPVQAQGISTSGSTGPSASDIAAAVRLELQGELLRVLELSKLHGLVIGSDLVVTETTRTAGTVAQTIATAGSTTTVRRQP